VKIFLRRPSQSLDSRFSLSLRIGCLTARPPGKEVEVLENPTELSEEDVLPGFVLNFRRVWI